MEINNGNGNGNWGDYSRLVLDQLKNLNSSMTKLREDFDDVKKDLIYIKAREDKIVDLIKWKEAVIEIAPPKTLKEALERIEELNKFKNSSVAIFGTIQFIMGILVIYLEFFRS